jgi:hypothetical protein
MMDRNGSEGFNLANRRQQPGRGKSRRGLEHVDVEVGANLREYRIRARLGCVDKLNPDADAGKQDEGGEALDQLVVAGGDAA